MALDSSLGELGVFEEECLRWCTGAGDRFGEPAISACEVLVAAAQDMHVQVLLRASSLEYRDSMVRYSIRSLEIHNHLYYVAVSMLLLRRCRSRRRQGPFRCGIYGGLLRLMR